VPSCWGRTLGQRRAGMALCIPSSRAAGLQDGTSLGWAARAVRDRHSSVHCCTGSSCGKQEKTLTRSSNGLVSSQPAPVGPEPLGDGQHHPRAAAAAPQGGEPHREIRRHTEVRKAIPCLRQEGAGQSDGEMSCWSHAVPICHTQRC